MCSVLHHVEICVKEEVELLTLLIKGFGFTPFALHLTPLASKWALKCGTSIFVVIKRNNCDSQDGVNGDYFDHGKRKVNGREESLETESSRISRNADLSEPEDWTVFCCRDQNSHSIDSVFNVALVVKDVDEVTERVRLQGGQVLKEPTDINDSHGHVRYSIVASCCGNIVHTLIDKRNYSGEFLPRFQSLVQKTCSTGDSSNASSKATVEYQLDGSYSENHDVKTSLKETNVLNEILQQSSTQNLGKGVNDCYKNNDSLSTHIDHVTYACEAGTSKHLIAWYEYCFGMKRFMANSKESKEEGFVLEDDIGLRLKALEYWRCAEIGLSSPTAMQGDSSLKVVIAEPLVSHEKSHINTFLQAHKGPGVQHVGLHTPTMTATVKNSSQQGVVFRKPPSAYYQEGIKKEEIVAAGHGGELDLFQDLGILLDTEPDVFSNMEHIQEKTNYLLQVFTTPIFKEDTFFLEVIQRCGARGFGAGNITALSRSIILHKQQQQQQQQQQSASP